MANPVAFSTAIPTAIPRFSVNDYVKHVYTQSNRGIVINVDPTKFSYFGSTIPAYLVGWEDGDESWVNGGSIRKCNGRFNPVSKIGI